MDLNLIDGKILADKEFEEHLKNSILTKCELVEMSSNISKLK